jgi:hypothetical protein
MSVGNIKTIMTGQYAAHATGSSLVPPTIVAADWDQARKKYVVCYCAADATAATDIERALFTVTPNHSGGILLFGAWILPDAAVTLDASHYTTLQLGTRPQAGGGSQTAIGTAITTAATSWVALSQVALYSNTAGVAVAQNLTITLAKTHTGNGVAIPNMRVVLEFAEA